MITYAYEDHKQELGKVYRFNDCLKMWHIAARQNAAEFGIKIALYIGLLAGKALKSV